MITVFARFHRSDVGVERFFFQFLNSFEEFTNISSAENKIRSLILLFSPRQFYCKLYGLSFRKFFWLFARFFACIDEIRAVFAFLMLS